MSCIQPITLIFVRAYYIIVEFKQALGSIPRLTSLNSWLNGYLPKLVAIFNYK